jgi:hypothetical protein
MEVFGICPVKSLEVQFESAHHTIHKLQLFSDCLPFIMPLICLPLIL